MSTLQNTTRVPARTRAKTRIAAIIVALGAGVAIGVSALTLALTGASTRNNAAVVTQSIPTGLSAPPINSYGTGHAVLDPASGQMHGGGVLSPAGAAGAQTTARTSPGQHKSYGAVP
jgi:hypothetical protein